MQYYESTAFGEWCRRVYGSDMKQIGALTMSELEILFREVELSPNSDILDIGCGAGHISAVIAKHYKSNIKGIDIDINAIEYAKKTFSNNKALNFFVSDVHKTAYALESFDMICFIDTLYLAGSIKGLRSMLDKYFNMLKSNGKLVVFWTNQPNKQYNIFDISSPSANNTQVGIWAINNNVTFKAFDLTEANRLFWFRALQECKAMEYEFKNEIPEYYDSLLDECIHYAELCEKGDTGGIFRWFYVFEKHII